MIKTSKFLILLLLSAVACESNVDNTTVKSIAEGTTSKSDTDDTTTPSVDKFATINNLTAERYGHPCEPYSPKMPDFRAPGRRISEVKCFEYAWKARYGMQDTLREIECDTIKYGYFHIIGGRNAKLGEFSHMGALGWKAVEGTWVFKCGATLISDKFALTAAHCSSTTRDDPTVDGKDPKIVRLGAKTIRDLTNHNTPATDAQIKQIIVHPRYHPPRQYYDIALVELQEPTKYQWLVHPACLHSTFEIPETAMVAGWGVINLATLETSPNLQVAEVSLVDFSTCDGLLQSRRNRRWKGLLRHQICAGHLAGGIDSCQGDSGGPLSEAIHFNKIPKDFAIKWTLHRVIGVTSFGYGCARANSPGIYTRVASFIGWIENIVWPENNTSTITYV